MTATPTQNAEAAATGNRDDFGLIFMTTRSVQENRTHAYYHVLPAQRKSRA